MNNIKTIFKKYRPKIALILAIIIILLIAKGYNLLFSTNTEETEWNVDYMKYSKLHSISKGEGQKIALIDTGISEFQKVNKNINLTNSNNIYDVNGHGTGMYSLIKGYENEITGIAPESDIIAIKVMEDDESIRPEILEKAIKIAIEEDVDIINLSLGSTKYSSKISELINEANQKNIIVVSSAGDYEQSFLLYPAELKNVISVGGIAANGRPLDQMNAPEKTVINAPGDDIKVVNHKKEVFYTSGTSQATAIISGYTALVRDTKNKNEINVEEMKELLGKIKDERQTYVKMLKMVKKSV